MVPRQPAVEYVSGAVFRGYRPRGRLRAAVELIWTVDGVPLETGERVLPNGVVELIVNLGDPHRVVHGPDRTTRYRRVFLAGMQRGPLDIAPEGASRLVGIRFRPGGAAPVLGLPLSEVTDHVVELEGRLGARFRRLRERLLEARDDSARITLVELALERTFAARAPDGRVATAVQAFRAAGPGARVGSVARTLGASHKHLIDLFLREVGVAPKMHLRIQRFADVLAALATGAGARWTDLAHAHGYADQAHLAHDFRALAGVRPTDYLRARTVDPNHLSAEALAHRPLARGR